MATVTSIDDIIIWIILKVIFFFFQFCSYKVLVILETRGLKVNINTTKLIVMDKNLLLGHKGRVGANPNLVSMLWKVRYTKDVQGLEIWEEQEIDLDVQCVWGGIVAVSQRLEVGEDSTEINSGQLSLSWWYNFMWRGVETAVRDRISCAWSKWRELANLLENHSIPHEERAKVHCACLRPTLLFAAET